VLVAISWPKPFWDPDEAVRSRGLPPGLEELAAAESRAGRNLRVRLFQAAARPTTDRVELLAVAPQKRRSLHLREVPLPELPERVAAFVAGQPVGPPIDAPTVLVCTDGRHDRCCAVHGRGVYEALQRDRSREKLDLRVVESSHLGGHRFAATSLFLPGGEMYGQLRASDAASLLQAWRSGRVWIPRFRGRIGTPELEQVAESAFRARHPAARSIEVTPADASDDVATLHVQGCEPSGSIDLFLECRRRPFRGPADCGDDDAKVQQRWVVSAVREKS
jgi:hypothetical protein